MEVSEASEASEALETLEASEVSEVSEASEDLGTTKELQVEIGRQQQCSVLQVGE